MSGGMAELRDSGIMIQLAHHAMLKMGINADEVWQRLGVRPEVLQDRNLRPPPDTQRSAVPTRPLPASLQHLDRHDEEY